MTGVAHTPGPWFVGTQNDGLYIIAGRKPAPNNDYPWHDAPRVCLATMQGPSASDCLPVNKDANAARIVACVNACEGIADPAVVPDLVKAAKGMLPRNMCLTNANIPDNTIVPLEASMGELRALAAILAKASGGAA
jgi:hypothetical protein